jgi:hypothetical protein
MGSRNFLAICVSLLSLACSRADAVSTASVWTEPLTLNLVDLDESDGIAPSILFKPGGSGGRGHAEANVTGHHGVTRSDSGYFLWGPAERHASVDSATASTSVSSSGVLAGSTFVASGSARGYQEGGQASFSTFVRAPYTLLDFTLSANTLLEISLSSHISVATMFSPDTSKGGESAEAYVRLHLSGTGPTGAGLQSSYDQHWLDAGLWSGVPSDEGSQTVSVSFLNQTSISSDGRFQLTIATWGHSQDNASPPIPEPATAGLLLSGLALMGVLRHSRIRMKRK